MSAYQTQRQAVIAELIADGLSDAAAANVVRDWEFEANRRGLDVRDARFWPEARQWIAERREADVGGAEDTDAERREA